MSVRLLSGKLLLVLAVLASSFADMPIRADKAEPRHGMGVLLSDPDDYPALEIPVAADAPATAIDLSAALPPVADQGIEPTCTLWAVGYYYKTLQEEHERSWGVSGPDHQFSPSYLYGLTAGCNTLQPVAIPAAMQVVQDKGAATLSAFASPIFSTCRIPSAEDVRAALSYRALSYGYLFVRQGKADIDRLKAYLANGDAFVLSIPVYDSFYYYHGQPAVIGLPETGERL
jgi:hypothetical protein